jgi:hypothetical protein
VFVDKFTAAQVNPNFQKDTFDCVMAAAKGGQCSVTVGTSA